jgi:hypothetical protein
MAAVVSKVASITTCGDWFVTQKALESRSGQTVPSDHAPLIIGDRNLKHVLCEVHRNRRSIHSVSSWFELMGVSSTRLMMPQNREESRNGHHL